MKSGLKKKSLFLFLIFAIFFVSFLSLRNEIFYNGKQSNIDIVLKSKAYAYLPDEAKEYIKEVYEETGGIPFTEKNKKEDMPYLNPNYIDYLENPEQYEIIPEPTITDFNMKGVSVNNDLYPSTYNLRDVEGNSYVTPAGNQGSFGLCWDFATTSQIESFLLVTNNTPYTNNAKRFSERQVDYATSNDGILEGNDFYNYRELGSGGFFSFYMQPALDGLALVDASFNGGISNYNSVDKLEARKVFRHSDSQYEVNSTVSYPYVDLNTVSDEERTAYLNGLKNAIMNYGGLVVSFDDSETYCSIEYKSSRLIYDDNKCRSTGHGMHIIGWDDNAEYSLCTNVKTGNDYSISSDISNCPSENIVNGKGVWLVKNSDGSDKIYYIAYDTHGTPFYHYITELSESTWDNNNLSYAISSSLQEITINDTLKKVLSYSYTKKNSGQEIIDKIKYNEGGQNRRYNIYLDDGEELEYLGTLNTTYPGYYNLDLSDKNIYVNNDTFTIYFDIDLPQEELENSYNALAGVRTRIYTSNTDGDIKIKTNNAEYTGEAIAEDNKYQLFVKSTTKNLNEGATVDYKILDDNGLEIAYNYNYYNNDVYMNHISSSIEINGDLPAGNYTLQTIYSNVVYSTSTIAIEKDLVHMSGGTGTIEDPYLIETPEQLNLIRLDQSAYYKLINDIDLSFDTKNPNGKFYNDGKGWEPIVYENNKWKYFYGGLDGNGHTIRGLFINRPEESYVGLFSRIYTNNYSLSQIKNLNFENVDIKGNTFVGALAGTSEAANYTYCLELLNISLLSGSVSGNNFIGGISGYLSGGSDLTGYCNSGGDRQVFRGLYNGATINGSNLVGGLFGHVAQFSSSYRPIPLEISNVENIGDVEGSISAGGLFGGLKLFDGKTTTISNAINIGNVSGKNCRNDISCNVDSQSTSGILNLNNIYYKNLGDVTSLDVTINYNNVNNYTINDIKNADNYSNWESFNDYWTIKKIDNIDRIPVLKFVPFEYTSIDNININYGEQVNLYNYINPKIDKAKDVSYEIEDTTIATIDEEGNINGLKKGTTNIHIFSNYDGYENDVPINVIKNTGLTIIYDSNGGTGTMESTYISSGKSGETSANGFTRTGYNFKNWNTKADGTGTKYPVYEKIINNQDDDWSMTLYAIWEPINHNVNFYANNGTYEGATQVVLDSVETQLRKNTFVTDGYTFKEWNTKADGTGATYEDEATISINADLHLYAIWIEEEPYKMHDYIADEVNKYISEIDIYTPINTFTSHFYLGYGYGIDVDYKEINNIQVIYTGGKTRITHGLEIYAEYTNIVKGDVTGDGKLNYLDYVNVYNHIQKVKHPESDKNLLVNEYLIAGDMSSDGKINYMDYVNIYNKIKELKGGSN